MILFAGDRQCCNKDSGSRYGGSAASRTRCAEGTFTLCVTLKISCAHERGHTVPACIERSIRVLIEYRSYWAAGEFVPQQFDDITLWQSPMLKDCPGLIRADAGTPPNRLGRLPRRPFSHGLPSHMRPMFFVRAAILDGLKTARVGDHGAPQPLLHINSESHTDGGL